MHRSTTPGGPLGPPDHFYGHALRALCSMSFLAAVVAASGDAGAALSIFDLADRSDVIAVGTVTSAAPTKNRKLEVFTIEPARALKGDPGTELNLVQELLFPETKP